DEGRGELENRGHAVKAPVAHQAAKEAIAELAGADSGVAIDARSELAPAVVQMKGLEVLEADDRVELGEHPLGVPSKIVAGRERVASVEAHAGATRIAHLVEDPANLGEA